MSWASFSVCCYATAALCCSQWVITIIKLEANSASIAFNPFLQTTSQPGTLAAMKEGEINFLEFTTRLLSDNQIKPRGHFYLVAKPACAALANTIAKLPTQENNQLLFDTQLLWLHNSGGSLKTFNN